MHVLTVYAHPNPKSFCHAVLVQFCEGLREAQTVEIKRIGASFSEIDKPATEDSSRLTRRESSQGITDFQK